MSVVLGVGTVGITYALARVGYQSRTVGLAAALALATNYLHVRDSHFATVDTGMTFFVTMALFYAVKASRHPSVKHYALAGLFAGAATAAKYNAGLVISGLAALTIHRLATNDQDQVNTTRSSVIGRFVLAGVMMLIAFAVFSPYSLIHYRAALKELAGVHRFLSDAPGEYGLWVHLRTTFPKGFGWPLFLASLAGIVRGAWLRRPTDVILLAFVLPFFVHVAGLRAVYPRYIVPLVPALAVLAAELVVRGLARGRKPIVVAATIALAMPGLWRSTQFDRLAALKDTRILAAEWVSENLPRRSAILVCEGYGAPVINKDRRRPPWFEPHQVSCRRKAPRRGESNYLITHQHPVIWGSPPIPADLERLLEERGKVLARFDPFNTESTSRAYYYGHEGFYLPFSGLDTVERGGPKITIWDLGTDGEAIP